jgi:hypothetical protein
VPTAIIKDHEDIFTARFTGFVGALFRLTQVSEKTAPRRRLEKGEFRQKAE